MNRRRATLIAAAALCPALLTSGGAAAAASTSIPGHALRPAGSWSTAAQLPGIAALNQGKRAGIASVSCAEAGDCGAGGSYTDGALLQQAFVATETSGRWSRAVEVPGTTALNAGGAAAISSVSCPAAGDCSAGGSYTDSAGHQQAFVVTETNSTWGTAAEVPGTTALNAGGAAAISSVSCPAAGDCSAGGSYTDSSGHQQAFVVTQTNGIWGSAVEVPGTASLNAGGAGTVDSVSCPSPGNCSAGGSYASSSVDGIPALQAFVVTETNSTWGTAAEVPGTAALNSGGFAEIRSVSCAAAGKCSAGGEYTNSRPATQAFVVKQTNGTWGTAREVPGIAMLNKRHLAQVNSVSCASPGNCSAGGFYQDASFDNQAFVVTERGGVWGSAQEVPGTAALNTGSSGGAAISSVSCGAAGDCGAAGFYTDSSGFNQAFVVSETGGTWGQAEEAPGTAALNTGGHAVINSVSCPAAGTCSAVGVFTTSTTATEAFVIGETASG